MILQALKEYRERIKGLPEYGFNREQIKYRIVINMDGSFCSFTPCEEHERIEVPIDPRIGKAGIEPIPSFLWGSTEHIFGIEPLKKYKNPEKHGKYAQKLFWELNKKICNSIPDDDVSKKNKDLALF